MRTLKSHFRPLYLTSGKSGIEHGYICDHLDKLLEDIFFGKSLLHSQSMRARTHHPPTYENGFFSP
jgi:hypothetical protein